MRTSARPSTLPLPDPIASSASPLAEGQVTFDTCGSPDDLLHRLVRVELPGLVREMEEKGRSLPRYVLSEMNRFSSCSDPHLTLTSRVGDVCHAAACPPLSRARLEEVPEGIRLSLRRPWNDGTTDILFTRQELVGRLCSLVPPPRANSYHPFPHPSAPPPGAGTLYHGVLAAHSKLRGEVVPVQSPHSHRRQAHMGIRLIIESRASESSRTWPWAALLERVFDASTA